MCSTATPKKNNEKHLHKHIANFKTTPAKNPFVPGSEEQPGFIENKGQITDQNNKLNTEVLFLYNGPGVHVQLKQNSFSYEIIREIRNPSISDSIGSANKKFTYLKSGFRNENTATKKISSHRIDISFTGSASQTFTASKLQRNFNIIPYEPADDRISYFTSVTGEEGLEKIKHYKKILYKNLYPGIDLEFVINTKPSGKNILPNDGTINGAGYFKYNFIVHPGANINSVRLQINGASKTTLTAEGNIRIETTNGVIKESIPYSYEVPFIFEPTRSKKQVEANFIQLAENCFGLSADYDTTKILIIDPVPWSTYFGGNGDDRANSVTVNANGNVMIAGYTNSGTSIATSGAYQTTYGGNNDVLLVKYNSSGNRIWATYFGGSDLENGIDVTTDVNDNILVTGYTLSSNGISTTGSHQYLYGGGTTYGDAFIAKFSSSGTKIWSTYYGGYEEDFGNGIITDAAGNIFLTGYTTSSLPLNSIATPGAYRTTISGVPDVFIIKFNASGSRQWGTYFGSTNADYGSKIAIDTMGNLTIAGITYSNSGIADSNAQQSTYGGNGDAFITKFTSMGQPVWSTYLGGSSFDYGIDIAIDPMQNIIVAGSTNSTSGIATIGAFKSSKSDSSGADAYLTKLSPSGVRIWSTYIGGNNDEGGAGVATDMYGNIVVAGFTTSPNGMASFGAHKVILEGIDDAFLIKFNSSGLRMWSTYCGADNTDEANAVASDAAGNSYLAGLTNSTSGIASQGADQSVFGGGVYDVLLSAFTPNGGLFRIRDNILTGAQEICKGSKPTTITGSLINGGYSVRQYLWLSSTTGIKQGFAPATVPNDSINYSPVSPQINTWYRRLVTSGEFADTSASILVKVNQPPLPGFTINKPVQCLIGNTFQFTDTSKVTGGTLFRIWNTGDGTNQSAEIISKSYLYKSKYTIRLKVIDNNNCTDSISKFIIVEPNPVEPAITAIAPTLLQSSMAFAYHWYRNNVLISDSNRQQLTINSKGIYMVVADSINGCSNTSAIYIVNTTGVPATIIYDHFKVYPNPSEGILYLSSKKNLPFENAEIELWDAQGLLILKQEHTFYNGEDMKLDISNLKEGLYIIKVNNFAYKILKY